MFKKRGIFFTIDALLAASLLIMVIVILSTQYINEPETTHVSYLSQDMVQVFTNVQIGDIDNSYVAALIQSNDITRHNNTVLEQIGEFWAEGNLEYATNLSEALAASLIPGRFGFGIYADGEEIYARNKSVTRTLISSRKLISGIAKDKPIEGFTSRAFLQSIQNKQYASYTYFGGFVGQGNITVTIDDLPSGVTIDDMRLEIDAGGDFNLYVNKVQCNDTFTAGTGTMTADSWNISSCIPSLTAGKDNNITLIFQDTISNSFVGGGFVKVGYLANYFNLNESLGLLQQRFPHIAGIINLYDSFYVPGTLKEMEVRLHYNAEPTNISNTLYLTIGNKTVLRIPNATGEAIVIINNSNLSSQLTYADFDSTTVPIRVGFENVTFNFIFEGAADVALITDVSGSMDWRMDTNYVNGVLRSCNDAQLSDPDTQRLSIAKCLDKQFAQDIINISGNQIGLISFESTTETGNTVKPTTNFTQLNETIGIAVPETGYIAGGGTCICCGINSAKDILVENIGTSTLIATGATWLYYTGNYENAPADDPSNNSWYALTYANESIWPGGAAILGSTNGYSYSPAVNMELGSDLAGKILYADLWEHGDDTAGAPNDFSSGILNYTANTYGIAGADDGWDWDNEDGSGPFGYDDDIDYNEIVNGRLEMDNNEGGGRNRCSSDDCSGAYGIAVNITQAMYDTMQNGVAVVAFWYQWDDRSGNRFESSDQVWVKARWTSPSSGGHFLGSDLDSGDNGADGDNEIATANNPDNDFSGTYSEDISAWIEGPGMYYFELGGKLLASQNQEYGWWRFDDIELSISNATDHYFFRKTFTIADLSQVKRGILNVLSDDRAIVYLNGQQIDLDYATHEAEYWNRRGYKVDGSIFQTGTNVVAVELLNSVQAAKFDLELLGVNDSRDKAMMVMTDGQATSDAGCPQTGTASEEAIQAACEARENYGITVYAVGFSDAADESTLQEIAACGVGIYTKSNNVTLLEDFYQDVAASIVTSSRHAQTIEVEGTLAASTLYGDSYIKVNYTPVIGQPEFNEIELRFEEKGFQNCTLNVSVPAEIRVTEAVVTSYSSEHWTDLVQVDDTVVYNLSRFDPVYTTLGDPFIVHIPTTVFGAGNHSISMGTGDSPDNSTGCSSNNTLLYTGMVDSSVAYGSVLAEADGCRWTIQTEEDNLLVVDVPITYSGPETCSFTSTNISFNGNDSTELATYNLLQQLDFDDNNKINIDIDAADLKIEALFVPNVPSLWGPTIIEIRVWE